MLNPDQYSFNTRTQSWLYTGPLEAGKEHVLNGAWEDFTETVTATGMWVVEAGFPDDSRTPGTGDQYGCGETLERAWRYFIGADARYELEEEN